MATVLTLAEFQDIVKPAEFNMMPSENTISNRSADGRTRRATSGVSIWQGYMSLNNNDNDHGREVAALMDYVRQTDVYFTVSPYQTQGGGKQKYNGTSGVSNVTTNGTQVSGNALKVTGLPASFTFDRGDYISIANRGVDRLYRLLEPATANASGQATLTLNLPLPPTLPASGTKVECIRPRLTVGYVPNSYSGFSFVSGYAASQGASFEFYQALEV